MDRLSCRGELFEPGETPFQICSADLDQYIQSGRCSIHNRPLTSEDENRFSTLICWHVIEHIEDDLEFAKMLHGATADNGYLYIAVPARDDYWGIEDETTGHFRRYTRATLTDLLHQCGYEVPEVISSNVPTSNLLLGLSNAVIRNQESNKLSMNKEHQTVTSGVREIRWKTVYPSIFHLILNRFTLWPLHLLQKLFFDSDYGTMVIAVAKRSKHEANANNISEF